MDVFDGICFNQYFDKIIYILIISNILCIELFIHSKNLLKIRLNHESEPVKESKISWS